MNTFAEYRYKAQSALGRQAIINQIVRDLATRRLNLVGARGTGKSCVARAVSTETRVLRDFHGVVFCDVKGHAPDGDEQFFNALIRDMHQQLPDSVSKGLLDPKMTFPYDEILKETAEAWQRDKQRVLIILDGVDDTFLQLEDGWSFLCGLVEHTSLQFLCTSRRRIRELCNTRAKRDSLMHQRFKNPLELQPFDKSDLELIAGIPGKPENGVAATLLDWTGGHAGLTLALCDEAQNRGVPGEPLSVASINSAAKSMTAEQAEELELAWEDMTQDERELFVIACKIGEVPAASNNGARLQKLGFLRCESGKLMPSCRLIREAAGKSAEGVSLFREWFGTEARMLSSMKQVLQLRLGAKEEIEPELIMNVRDAIDAIERPDKAARAFRDIVREALELVWDAEFPTKKEVPYFKEGPDWLRRDRQWPTENSRCMTMLNMMTDDRKRIDLPKAVNRKVFAMLQYLTHCGDFKNHQRDQEMSAPFLISGVLTAVELVCEMKLAGLIE